MWHSLTIVARLCRLFVFSIRATFMIMYGRYIPAMDRNIMQDFREIMLESHLEENDWKDTVYTFVHLKAMISARLYEVFREADLYQDAPNGDVIKPDLSKTRLLEYQKKDRPLVLNFGSCT